MPTVASRDVIIQTPDLVPARAFHEGVLGLALFMNEPNMLGFEAGGLRLFVERREARGPVLDFLVDNLATAKGEILAAGCRLVEEDASIPRIYLTDPFGLSFNLDKRG
jgi:hypothetical protein